MIQYGCVALCVLFICVETGRIGRLYSMEDLAMRQDRTTRFLHAPASVRSQYSFQMLDDPLGRLAIPFRRNRALFPLSRHQSRQRRRQLTRIRSNEFVRPDRDGLWPLGVVTQGRDW